MAAELRVMMSTSEFWRVEIVASELPGCDAALARVRIVGGRVDTGVCLRG